MFKNWKVWLGFAISIVFFYVALRDVPLEKILDSLRRAQWFWFLPAFVIWFISLAARSRRWAVLMGGAPFKIAFHGTNIGYALNMTLPARLGEVARAFVVNDRTKIPVAKVLSSIVVERLLDLAVVVGLLALFALFVPVAPEALVFIRTASLGLALALAAGALVVWQSKRFEAILAALLRRFLPKLNAEPWLQRFRELCAGFGIIGTPRRFAEIALHTVILWLGALGFAFLTMQAFLPARLDQAGLFLVAANLGGAIPSAPGAVGVQEGAAVAALQPFNLDKASLISYALVWAFSQRIALIVLGVVGAFSLGISFSSLTKAQSKA